MSQPLLANKYARSLFLAAQEARILGPVERAFAAFCGLEENHADLAAALRHPLIPDGQRNELVRQVLGADGPKVFIDFVILVLTQRGHLSFREIYGQYRRMAFQAEGRALAEVTTAFPLGADDRQALTQALRAKMGKDVELEERVDRGLLGGITVQIGDQVWDGSIRNRLRELHDALRA